MQMPTLANIAFVAIFVLYALGPYWDMQHRSHPQAQYLSKETKEAAVRLVALAHQPIQQKNRVRYEIANSTTAVIASVATRHHGAAHGVSFRAPPCIHSEFCRKRALVEALQFVEQYLLDLRPHGPGLLVLAGHFQGATVATTATFVLKCLVDLDTPSLVALYASVQKEHTPLYDMATLLLHAQKLEATERILTVPLTASLEPPTAWLLAIWESQRFSYIGEFQMRSFDLTPQTPIPGSKLRPTSILEKRHTDPFRAGVGLGAYPIFFRMTGAERDAFKELLSSL